MKDTSAFWRQLDLVAPDRLAKLQATMIGAGGLGSPTAMSLAKMGVSKFKVYDFDTVELHNLPNQMYSLNDIGKLKVEALSELLAGYGAEEFEGITDPYMEQSLEGVVIVSADNMRTRKAVWESVKFNPHVPIFIDMRMGAEEGQIFALNPSMPDDIAFYESMLFDDEDALELPCSARAIIYNTFLMGSLVCNVVKKWVMDEPFPRAMLVDSAVIGVHEILPAASIS